ncbi:MAG: XRE family transcriptional regulator [Syntrophomonas sp.]
MEFKERLQYLRMEKDISEKELSDETSITESIIRLYEKGKMSVDLEHLKKLADYFDVSPKLLLGTTFPDLSPEDAINSYRAVQELVEIREKEKEKEEEVVQPDLDLKAAIQEEMALLSESSSQSDYNTVRHSSLKSGTVAFLNKIKTGIAPEEQEIESYWPVNSSITSMYGNDLSNYYYLRIHGDNMEPTIKDQGIVLVKTNLPVQNKDLVVVMCTQDEAAKVRRITRYNNKIILLSDNQNYPAQVYNEPDCTILGKVLWKTISLQQN